MSSVKTRARFKVKDPIVAFQACPACNCRELIPFGIQVSCSSCDWNSIEAHGEMLSLDEFFKSVSRA